MSMTPDMRDLSKAEVAALDRALRHDAKPFPGIAERDAEIAKIRRHDDKLSMQCMSNRGSGSCFSVESQRCWPCPRRHRIEVDA